MSRKRQNKSEQAATEIIKLIRHMRLTLEPLEADFEFAAMQLSIDENSGCKHQQFWRRTLIRCLLANIEAMLWNMKNIIPKIALVSCVQLTSQELEVVNEKKLVNANGKIEARKYFPQFRENLMKTFSLFGKVHKLPVTLNYSQDFEALCRTYELRSRLMHPKRPFDPNVSDLEIAEALSADKWFVREYCQLMDHCEKAVPIIVKNQ